MTGQGKGIDPAALALAALAGGLTIFTEPGPYNLLDLMVGLSLLLVLLAYDTATKRTKFQSFAFGAICSFALLLVVGPALEWCWEAQIGAVSSTSRKESLVPDGAVVLTWAVGVLLFAGIDRQFTLPHRVAKEG